jgi:hypothetical protein
MKNILLLFAAVWLFSGCTKDITDFNKETKRPSEIPAGPLFSNSVKTLSDGLASAAVGTNLFRHFVKHWGQAVIQEEAQYDYITRAVNTAWWSIMYRDVIVDLRESARIISNDATMPAATKANQTAMADIMEVYTYGILVNTFGDIPYTDASQPEKLFPVYDDARTVYADLMKRLEKDNAMLNTGGSGFTASEDIIFQGNVSKWIAFGNSLQLRMSMILADVDNAAAKAAFEQADAKAMTSAAGNAVVKYYPATPNTNPLYNQLVLAGRTDFIAAKDLMDVLNNMDDPRKPGFFGVNNSGQYVGGVVGMATNFSNASKPSAKVAAPDAPNVLMDYSEIEFLRAEALERGFNIPGTVEEHYNNAIRASIIIWDGTNAQADTYLSRTDVAYNTAAGNFKQKIGFQKWIALYNRGFDGWTEMRRLDYPQLPLPVGAISGFPNRLRYPGEEQQLNGANYTAAATHIGGDETETKLFWDLF